MTSQEMYLMMFSRVGAAVTFAKFSSSTRMLDSVMGKSMCRSVSSIVWMSFTHSLSWYCVPV